MRLPGQQQSGMHWCYTTLSVCVLCRCYIVDDQAAVVITVDHANRDLDSVPLKVKEPRAFKTLLHSGVFSRRRRTNGSERCLAGQHNRHTVTVRQVYNDCRYITASCFICRPNSCLMQMPRRMNEC